MLNEIIRDLGDNYNDTDKKVLDDILNDATTNALFISNRVRNLENIKLLSSEIKGYVKTVYLQRGTEDVKNQSQNGLSSTYQDAYEKMRKDIISNGKRKTK